VGLDGGSPIARRSRFVALFVRMGLPAAAPAGAHELPHLGSAGQQPPSRPSLSSTSSSHFAVGGGLFLVMTERRARRTHDHDLLAYVRRHSRFFVLLTLVFGALTGVGIWFVIGLVHPSATSMLIQLFVWFWAIEWTFFVVEIVAALAYHYGWDRLAPATQCGLAGSTPSRRG
jgi:hypothetical protein